MAPNPMGTNSKFGSGPASNSAPSVPEVDLSHLTEEERLMIQSVMAKAEMAEMGVPVDTSGPSSTNLPSNTSIALTQQRDLTIQQQKQQQQQNHQQQMQNLSPNQTNSNLSSPNSQVQQQQQQHNNNNNNQSLGNQGQVMQQTLGQSQPETRMNQLINQPSSSINNQSNINNPLSTQPNKGTFADSHSGVNTPNQLLNNYPSTNQPAFQNQQIRSSSNLTNTTPIQQHQQQLQPNNIHGQSNNDPISFIPPFNQHQFTHQQPEQLTTALNNDMKGASMMQQQNMLINSQIPQHSVNMNVSNPIHQMNEQQNYQMVNQQQNPNLPGQMIGNTNITPSSNMQNQQNQQIMPINNMPISQYNSNDGIRQHGLSTMSYQNTDQNTNARMNSAHNVPMNVDNYGQSIGIINRVPERTTPRSQYESSGGYMSDNESRLNSGNSMTGNRNYVTRDDSYRQQNATSARRRPASQNDHFKTYDNNDTYLMQSLGSIQSSRCSPNRQLPRPTGPNPMSQNQLIATPTRSQTPSPTSRRLNQRQNSSNKQITSINYANVNQFQMQTDHDGRENSKTKATRHLPKLSNQRTITLRGESSSFSGDNDESDKSGDNGYYNGENNNALDRCDDNSDYDDKDELAKRDSEQLTQNGRRSKRNVQKTSVNQSKHSAESIDQTTTKLMTELKLTEQANQVMEQQQKLIKQSQELIKLQLEQQALSKELKKSINEHQKSKQTRSLKSSTRNTSKNSLDTESADSESVQEDKGYEVQVKDVGNKTNHIDCDVGETSNAADDTVSSSKGKNKADENENVDNANTDDKYSKLVGDKEKISSSTGKNETQPRVDQQQSKKSQKQRRNNHAKPAKRRDHSPPSDSTLDSETEPLSQASSKQSVHSNNTQMSTNRSVNTTPSRTKQPGSGSKRPGSVQAGQIRPREPIGLSPSPLPVAAAIQLHQMQKQYQHLLNAKSSLHKPSYINQSARSRSVSSSPMHVGCDSYLTSGYATDNNQQSSHYPASNINSRYQHRGTMSSYGSRPGSPTDTQSEYGGSGPRYRKRLPKTPANAVPVTPLMMRKIALARQLGSSLPKLVQRSNLGSSTIGNQLNLMGGYHEGYINSITSSNLSSLKQSIPSAMSAGSNQQSIAKLSAGFSPSRTLLEPVQSVNKQHELIRSSSIDYNKTTNYASSCLPSKSITPHLDRIMAKQSQLSATNSMDKIDVELSGRFAEKLGSDVMMGASAGKYPDVPKRRDSMPEDYIGGLGNVRGYIDTARYTNTSSRYHNNKQAYDFLSLDNAREKDADHPIQGTLIQHHEDQRRSLMQNLTYPPVPARQVGLGCDQDDNQIKKKEFSGAGDEYLAEFHSRDHQNSIKNKGSHSALAGPSRSCLRQGETGLSLSLIGEAGLAQTKPGGLAGVDHHSSRAATSSFNVATSTSSTRVEQAAFGHVPPNHTSFTGSLIKDRAQSHLTGQQPSSRELATFTSGLDYYSARDYNKAIQQQQQLEQNVSQAVNETTRQHLQQQKVALQSQAGCMLNPSDISASDNGKQSTAGYMNTMDSRVMSNSQQDMRSMQRKQLHDRVELGAGGLTFGASHNSSPAADPSTIGQEHHRYGTSAYQPQQARHAHHHHHQHNEDLQSSTGFNSYRILEDPCSSTSSMFSLHNDANQTSMLAQRVAGPGGRPTSSFVMDDSWREYGYEDALFGNSFEPPAKDIMGGGDAADRSRHESELNSDRVARNAPHWTHLTSNRLNSDLPTTTTTTTTSNATSFGEIMQFPIQQTSPGSYRYAIHGPNSHLLMQNKQQRNLDYVDPFHPILYSDSNDQRLNDPSASYIHQHNYAARDRAFNPADVEFNQTMMRELTQNDNPPPQPSAFSHLTKDDIISSAPKFNSIGYRFKTSNQNKYVSQARSNLNDSNLSRYPNPYKRILLSKNPKDRIGNGIGISIVGGVPMQDLYDPINKCIVTSGAFVSEVFQSSNVHFLGDMYKGDQIIEWNGVNLCNRSNEEVQQILLSQFSDDEVEIIYLPQRKATDVYGNDVSSTQQQRQPYRSSDGNNNNRTNGILNDDFSLNMDTNDELQQKLYNKALIQDFTKTNSPARRKKSFSSSIANILYK